MGDRVRFSKHDRAEITGLPLMLLILVVVAGIGLAVILGVMGKVGDGPDGVGTLAYADDKGTTLARLELTGTAGTLAQPASAKLPLVVTVYDTSSGTVSDATVTVTGPVETPATAFTGADGKAKFCSTTWVLPPQKMTGEIKVAVEKAGWPAYESTFLLVRGTQATEPEPDTEPDPDADPGTSTC